MRAHCLGGRRDQHANNVLMSPIRPDSVLEVLHRQAGERSLIDYEGTRRAFARQEALRQYADWVNVGGAGAPAFQSGWSQYSPSAAYEGYLGEQRSPVGFFRDRWGQVHLRGMVQGPLDNSTIFVLPPDLCPDQYALGRSYYITEGTGAFAGVYFRYACMIGIATGGSVFVDRYYVTNTFSGAKMITLDGIHFEAANKGDPLNLGSD